MRTTRTGTSFLAAGERAYCIWGCADRDLAYVLPRRFMLSLLKELYVTHRKDSGKRYWQSSWNPATGGKCISWSASRAEGSRSTSSGSTSEHELRSGGLAPGGGPAEPLRAGPRHPGLPRVTFASYKADPGATMSKGIAEWPSSARCRSSSRTRPCVT
jgi:hypothetical protein